MAQFWSHHVIVHLHFLKFTYSEKATKFCEIFTLLLSYVVPVKSKVKILQNLVAFSEYMNFKNIINLPRIDILQSKILGVSTNFCQVRLTSLNLESSAFESFLMIASPRWGNLNNTSSILLLKLNMVEWQLNSNENTLGKFKVQNKLN